MKIISGKYFCRTIAFIGLLFIALQLNAQIGTVVKGKVTDSKGESLPGATVVEKNKDNRQVNGTVTGLNGEYQLKISDKSNSLYFSFIGMRQVVKTIKEQTIINVTMVDDVKELSGFTVTAAPVKPPVDAGGFLAIAQRDQTSSITSINMATLENIPATSIDQILEGQVSGMLVSMNSGDPGSGSSIQIRGATSLGLGSRPLIVVDDVPYKTNEAVDLTNTQGLSELVNISPSDIATIDVLKDAAATALYGSDGANGVIVINTKRGDNIKPRVNVTSSTTLIYPQKPLPLLNGDNYKTMILEAYQNRYGTDINLITSPIGNLFLEPTALNYENYNNNTYWPDQVNMVRGFGQNLTGSIIGGGEAAQYSLSLGYNNTVGPIIGTKFNRVTGRFNFDYKISDKLRFISDISYSSDNKTSSYDNVNSISLIKAPVLPVFNQDIYGNPLSTFFFPGVNGFQGDVDNPVALIYKALSDNSGSTLTGNVSVRYAPFKGVQLNSSVATTYQTRSSNQFLPYSATGSDFYRTNNIYLVENNDVNLASLAPLNGFQIYFKNDLIYTLKKDKHTLQSLVSSIYQSSSSRSINLAGTNTPTEDFTMPYLTDIMNNISSSKSLKRDFSVVGQLYYLYDDRYAISGSVRREGNSAFGKRNRYGTFPSVSGFWRPSSEAFLKERYSWLDQFKFRGSWGITGRPPATSAANAFTLSSNMPFIDIQGITPDNIELVNLRWEKTTSSNLGMDLSIWKGRLSLVTDFSRAITRDLFMSVPISPTSGFETIQRNYGTLGNNIFEGSITGQPVANDKWQLTVSFNISKINGKVLALPNDEPVIRDNALDNGKFMTMINVGDAIGTFYGLQSLGVYSKDEDAFATDAKGNFIVDFSGKKIPMRWSNQNGMTFSGGDAHYADINHDGLINSQDVVSIGNASPDFFGGLMFRLKYDNSWELFTNFVYQYKFDIVNMAKMSTSNMYYNDNQTTAVMRRWRKQGDVTDIPRALWGTGYNWVGSDRFVEDGSFLKCNTVSLAYNLKPKMLAKLKFRSVKLALTVYNAFILTKYSGVDPSVSANTNDPFYIGRDNSLTPTPITYTLGIWLNF